ncbi:MAG TPA: rod shape-determining protein MreD [Actinomycetota bacterium]|nr:rod shape-determining protein MreD [Actinomycetota bacterium]
MSLDASRVRPPGLLGEIGLGRISAIAAAVVLALALQSTVLARATLLGVIPQLLLVVIVSLAYVDGERVGTVAGFTGGLLVDLSLPEGMGAEGSIIGLTALVYTLTGYGVGVLRQYSTSESVWMPVLAVAVATAVAETSYALMAIMLGQRWVGIAFTAKVIGLVVLYNTLLAPFTFPVIKRIADHFRPAKVHR